VLKLKKKFLRQKVKKKEGLENNKEIYRKENTITFLLWSTSVGENKHNIPMTGFRDLPSHISTEILILTYYNF